jgi:acyl dehydratase
VTGLREQARLAPGAGLADARFSIHRVDEIKYCGVHWDFVGPHWNERSARAAGLPDVIAHGPLTVARMLRVLSGLTGDPGAVTEYQARFHGPVLLPDDDEGALIQVRGAVTGQRDDGSLVISLTAASVPDDEVLVSLRAVIAPARPRPAP